MSDKWLCSLPWTAISNDPDGKVRPCCIYKDVIKDNQGNDLYLQTTNLKDIFHSDYMKNLRQEFLSGNKPVGCSVCIKDEENGYKSKRMIYQRKIDYSQTPEYPEEQQLIISNACNLKCRSCTPSHSNSWQAEMKILFNDTGYSMPHRQVSDNSSVFWQTRKDWMGNIKTLEVVGGEPFYINKWQTLWEEMIELGYSKNITINFTTNTTITNFELLEKLVNNFAHIGISLSIDGTGKVYEYLRHPGKWDSVLENIKQYHLFALKHRTKVGITICHTIGWLNAFYLPEFHNFVYQYFPAFKIWNNIIHFPDHMALSSMPEELKTLIIDKIQKFNFDPRYETDVQAIINCINNGNPQTLDKLLPTFELHDKHRNENIKESFQEVFQLFQAV
jgi:sulfatase maturation enzyme AslB (radical SAM superfamily)